MLPEYCDEQNKGVVLSKVEEQDGQWKADARGQLLSAGIAECNKQTKAEEQANEGEEERSNMC